ncbi:MAG: hypothetical protein GX891_05550 [Clostridiales bacterium]|nr:hypothetical protein [Clostridiales bacterium]
MAFYKSKQEREILAQMERDEQMQVFNDQINELTAKRQEYANIAAQAEINGDMATYDIAVNALVELNDIISSLTQTKANFDIINVSNSIARNLASAVNALDKMAGNKTKMPDIKKIQKANLKISKYMRNIKISQKAMANVLRTSNPANRARSQEDIASVRPMIDAARAKLTGGAMPKAAATLDLAAEIEQEKNKTL